MWQYVQSTGELFDGSGALIERGYAGKGAARNRPEAECEKDAGPLPRGWYTIGEAIDHPRSGPVTLPLIADADNPACTTARDGFLIHGDSKTRPGEASAGCIVLSRTTRERLRDSRDRRLAVLRDRNALAIAERVLQVPVQQPARVASYALHPDAEALVIDAEGLGQPGTWPGGASGITIGYGYDLGYQTRDQFETDWGAYLPDPILERLSAAIGLRGLDARQLAPSLIDIRIAETQARRVFLGRMVEREWLKARQAFPGVELLPTIAQGALVSLVMNRGASMKDSPGRDNRKEMRAIRDLCASIELPIPERLARIAREIRAMKRLWEGKGLGGLIRRREAEAEMVERAVVALG